MNAVRSIVIVLLFSFAPARIVVAQFADHEFFENRVRPILVEHCYSCHSGKAAKLKAGLRLDSRKAILDGGDSGPAFEPGKPENSRLIEAIEYKNVDLQMPPKGRLPAAAIEDLRTWVKRGAPWPAGEREQRKSAGFDLAARRSSHWAWQPIRAVQPPDISDTRWSANAVDRFIFAKLREAKLAPASPAAAHAILRRVYFDIVGLPPPADVAAAFAANPSRAALESIVDRLLASPQFGERWARHWLDLVRYAETRGNEFDYITPNAWQYRDYLIRAYNDDVPYDQFMREHLAGDLLSAPRRKAAGINESILATGVWSLGEQVHSPVDLRQDEADHVDGMIDVLTKSFLGLTVSCARCHDHKFDAISAKDYYALAGVFKSAGVRQVRFETADREREIANRLAQLESEHRAEMRRHIAVKLRERATQSVEVQLPPTIPSGSRVLIDFASSNAADWRPDGAAFGSGPRNSGELLLDGDAIRVNTMPAAVADAAFVGLKTTGQLDPGDLGKAVRAGRTIRTPSKVLTSGRLYYLVRGPALVYAAVQAHQMVEGPLHRQLVKSIEAGRQFRWVEHDLHDYPGHRAHVEFTATGPGFAVAAVIEADGAPPAAEATTMTPKQVRATIDRFANDQCTPTDAAAIAKLLDGEPGCVRISPEYAAARAAILRDLPGHSQLAPALYEGSGFDESVFIRGSPKNLGPAVPRRFLEALGAAPLHGPGSGRLELAAQFTDPQRNPLLTRVAVNRVWHHLFGRGLVPSVDNFGALGELPTHPDLLDWLADDFVRNGWSIKKLIRSLVLTEAYGMSPQGDTDAERADAGNRLLHRANLRRLDSETIRDAMLAIAGTLKSNLYGPPVPVHLTAFMDGRGKPAKSGPLDGGGRRSIYLEVRRNFLDPFQTAFDQPAPAVPVGRRTVSNVPAQALVLLNDPFVHQQSAIWSRKVLVSETVSADRVRRMFREALARTPSADEIAACIGFVEKAGGNAEAAWADLAHALWNAKEFIFIP